MQDDKKIISPAKNKKVYTLEVDRANGEYETDLEEALDIAGKVPFINTLLKSLVSVYFPKTTIIIIKTPPSEGRPVFLQ